MAIIRKLNPEDFESDLKKEIGNSVFEALFETHLIRDAKLHDIWGKPIIYFYTNEGEEYQAELTITPNHPVFKPYLSIRYYDGNPDRGGYYPMHRETKDEKAVYSDMLSVSKQFIEKWYNTPQSSSALKIEET